MKRLILSCLLLTSCGNLADSPVKKPGNQKKIWARITYYHCNEDKWGARVAASPKIKNKAGFGVAAHPDFQFYTKVRIPILSGKLDSDDEFQVIDRGSAVTSKKASGGETYVFDVFVPRNKIREFSREMPRYTWVIVEE